MHRMRVRAGVPENDPEPVAFRRAQGRSGHPAIVRPGREHDARRDLDLLVLGSDLEGSERAAVRQVSRPSRSPNPSASRSGRSRCGHSRRRRRSSCRADGQRARGQGSSRPYTGRAATGCAGPSAARSAPVAPIAEPPAAASPPARTTRRLNRSRSRAVISTIVAFLQMRMICIMRRGRIQLKLNLSCSTPHFAGKSSLGGRCYP